MAFSSFFLFTHKLLVLEQTYFTIFSSLLYICSISILVSKVHNVSFVLAALFLKCFIFKRTIC